MERRFLDGIDDGAAAADAAAQGRPSSVQAASAASPRSDADATGTCSASLSRSQRRRRQAGEAFLISFFKFSHASRATLLSFLPSLVAQPLFLPLSLSLPPSLSSNTFFQVIARTSGRCLGVVDHMYIDSETYRVVSVELRAKGLAAAAGIAASGAVAGSSSSLSSAPVSTWGARPQQGRLPFSSSFSPTQLQQQPTGTNLPLATLCQVGDVVLVHDERALSFPPLDGSRRSSFSSSASSARRGPGGRYSTTPPPRLVRLTGAEVVSADGARVLGKVRGYGFDPETGELLALRFDALGVPRIPEGEETAFFFCFLFFSRFSFFLFSFKIYT